MIWKLFEWPSWVNHIWIPVYKGNLMIRAKSSILAKGKPKNEICKLNTNKWLLPCNGKPKSKLWGICCKGWNYVQNVVWWGRAIVRRTLTKSYEGHKTSLKSMKQLWRPPKSFKVLCSTLNSHTSPKTPLDASHQFKTPPMRSGL
jgi:hypothetical protein